MSKKFVLLTRSLLDDGLGTNVSEPMSYEEALKKKEEFMEEASGWAGSRFVAEIIGVMK